VIAPEMHDDADHNVIVQGRDDPEGRRDRRVRGSSATAPKRSEATAPEGRTVGHLEE